MVWIGTMCPHSDNVVAIANLLNETLNGDAIISVKCGYHKTADQDPDEGVDTYLKRRPIQNHGDLTLTEEG